MKHIRTRRRLKLILISFLVLSFLLFLENRIEAFAPQLKDIVESRLDEMAGKEITVSIGSLDGGIIRPLVLHDIELRDKNGKVIFPFLKITSITSSFRIWDAVSKAALPSRHPGVFVRRPYFIVNFITKNREVMGYARVESQPGAPLRADGSLKLFDSERIDFNAEAGGDTFKIDARPRTGSFKVEGSMPSDTELGLRFVFDHLKVHNFDIAGKVAINNRMVKDAAGLAGKVKSFGGEISTEGLSLNHKSYFDLKGSYKVSEGLFGISDLKLGKDAVVNGTIGLRPPYLMNIVITYDNVSMTRILSYFNAEDALKISGTLNSKFELKGPLKKIRLNARMDIRQGSIGGLDFDRMTASLRGEGPLIKIEDSSIARQSGYFSLEGYIDLSKMGKGNVFEGIRLTSDDRALLWDGWDATRLQDIQEFRMNKKVTEDFNLDFTKFISDDRIDESMRQNDKFGFEYRLQSNESLKLEVGQDTNFFGVQHKDRF